MSFLSLQAFSDNLCKDLTAKKDRVIVKIISCVMLWIYSDRISRLGTNHQISTWDMALKPCKVLAARHRRGMSVHFVSSIEIGNGFRCRLNTGRIVHHWNKDMIIPEFKITSVHFADVFHDSVHSSLNDLLDLWVIGPAVAKDSYI